MYNRKKSIMKKLNLLIILISLISGISFSQGSSVNDTVLIRKAAMDYIEGAYSGDTERMERAIHPELQKVIPVKLPQTGRDIFQYSNYSMLVEGTRAGMGKLPEEQWNIDYELLDWDQNIATVKITSVRYIDYCHLARIDGSWKIINVLWRQNRPPAGAR